MNEPQKNGTLSRRTFAAALAASPLLAQQTPAPSPAAPVNEQRHGTTPEVPPFQANLEFTRRAVPGKVQPFPMTQVRLLPGPFQEAMEWNRGYLQRLPADRLLHNFRVNSGLPSSVQPLGGWEKNGAGRDAELRGHFTGHYLSAMILWMV